MAKRDDARDVFETALEDRDPGMGQRVGMSGAMGGLIGAGVGNMIGLAVGTRKFKKLLRKELGRPLKRGEGDNAGAIMAYPQAMRGTLIGGVAGVPAGIVGVNEAMRAKRDRDRNRKRK